MMSTIYEKAFNWIIRAEGGYVNDSQDPGGETKYGISKHAYPQLDIKNLTLDQAKEIYYKDYWLKCKCDQLPEKLALIVFDFAVNAGISRSIKTLQRALNLSQDGIIGNQTLSAVGSASTSNIITDFMTQKIMFYASLANFDAYGRGWTKRCFGLMGYVYA
jgi:lysozyme family protein